MRIKSVVTAAEKSLANRAVRKKISAVTFACALVMAMAIAKGAEPAGKYVVDDDGYLRAISRGDDDVTDYRVEVEVENSPELTRRYTIVPSAPKGDNGAAQRGVDDDGSAVTEAEIGRLINEIERSEDRRIELPGKLSDGTEIKWKKAEKGDASWLYVAFIYAALVLFIVFGTKDPAETEINAARSGIVRRVPRFINQLLLLMNAGLILSDAFRRICSCYELVPDEKRTLFEREMISVNRRNSDNSMSTAALVGALASKYNVKELMRISSFMNDNEKKGSDILESLGRESRYLWDERKIVAAEKGKMIDTKMAYPLGLLLILLIVITMAPAMIAM